MRIILNPDKDMVEKVTEALRKNDGYCPCALIKNDDTKCMCKDFRNSAEPGPCHCELYVRVED